jgi:hypothetical protein
MIESPPSPPSPPLPSRHTNEYPAHVICITLLSNFFRRICGQRYIQHCLFNSLDGLKKYTERAISAARLSYLRTTVKQRTHPCSLSYFHQGELDFGDCKTFSNGVWTFGVRILRGKILDWTSRHTARPRPISILHMLLLHFVYQIDRLAVSSDHGRFNGPCFDLFCFAHDRVPFELFGSIAS